MKNYLSQPKFSTLGPRANFAAFGVGLRPDEIQANIGLKRVNTFAPNRRKLGSINLAPTGQPVSPQQGALQGAAAGASFGPIGAGVGAAIGVVVGLLSGKPNTAAHIGSWDTQLAQAIGGLPTSAAGIGRQIPWNENSHGLVQFIEALLATGNYMSWDPSLISNYDVCAHWATTFAAAVQSLTTAIVSSPQGQQASASIVLNTGASGVPTQNFTFVNPGIQIGPDAISAKYIMGSSGLMYWMIKAIGESDAHASSNANNPLAQKVYALMVDNIAATLMPAAAQPTIPVPNVAPAVVAASTTVNAAVAAAPAPPPAVQQPVAAPTPQIIVEQTPAAAVAPVSTGMSTNTLLLIGGIALAAIFMMQRK